MKREELFEIIGEVDEALLKRSESVKRKNVWVKLGTSAACALLAVAIAVPFFGGKGERIPLPNTTDAIKVYEMKKLPSQMTTVACSYAYNYTPKEIFAQKTDIYKGEIIDCDTLRIDFGGVTEYRSVVTIKVERAYRGEISEGETIRLLLPVGFYFSETPVYSSITKVVEKMEVGMKGIFMTVPYDESSCATFNGKTLMLSDIADCGMGDGERWCFLDTGNGIAMGDMWREEDGPFGALPYEQDAVYENITLDAVETYVLQMLKE